MNFSRCCGFEDQYLIMYATNVFRNVFLSQRQ